MSVGRSDEAAAGAGAMGTGTGSARESRSPDEIRRDIEATRAELGATVEALAAKTDVKGQARQKVEELKVSARVKRDELATKAQGSSPGGAQALGQQVVAKVKENPVPVAAGVGIFLLRRLTSRR